MDITLDVTITQSGEEMQFSEVVEEGESVVLNAEESDWGMEITPEEVTQIYDTKDELENCPICGDAVDETAFANHIGDSVDVDRVCVGEGDADSHDFLLYYHR
jgi:hypothetical protein